MEAARSNPLNARPHHCSGVNAPERRQCSNGYKATSSQAFGFAGGPRRPSDLFNREAGNSLCLGFRRLRT